MYFLIFEADRWSGSAVTAMARHEIKNDKETQASNAGM